MALADSVSGKPHVICPVERRRCREGVNKREKERNDERGEKGRLGLQ